MAIRTRTIDMTTLPTITTTVSDSMGRGFRSQSKQNLKLLKVFTFVFLIRSMTITKNIRII